MISFAVIHPVSGAIVMMTTSADAALPDHLVRRAAPAGVDPGLHWWNGWSFAPREDAPISAIVSGELVTIVCPESAFIALPDGTIILDRQMVAPQRRARVTLVGRYRGESWIEARS